MHLVLATSSPFRRELFRQHFSGFLWTIDGKQQFLAPDIDEKAIRHEDPAQLCQMIAVAKCEAVLREHHEILPDDAVVITFDQVVVCDGQLREKPKDEREARQFLDSYASGKPAECLSGVVVHDVASGGRLVRLDRARVDFAKFPRRVADHLVAAGGIFRASGGFTCGDRELAKYVAATSGTLDAIEGLPVRKVKAMVEEVLAAEGLFGPERPLATTTFAIFDMDGLLLDTEPLYSAALQKLLDPLGLTYTKAAKAKMMGRKTRESNAIMISHYGLDGKVDPEEWLRLRDSHLVELFADCDLMPGALRLLSHLHANNVPMAVATSSHRAHFDLKTAKHRHLFDKCFRHVVTGDEVDKGKPEPDIFVEAARRLAPASDGIVDPAKFLVFEDSAMGVEAAGRAGMPVVWVDDFKLNESMEEPPAATCTIPSLMSFEPEKFGLPGFP